MHFYTTPEFEQKAQQQGIASIIAKLRLQVERDGTDALELFEWIYPYLKRAVGRTWRIVGKLHKVGNEKVVCLLKLFTRGDREYEAFIKNPEDYGKQHLETLIDQEQIQRLINASRKKAIPARQPLPNSLNFWLQAPSWETSTTDSTIYESEVWVTQFKQREIQDHWETYYHIVLSLLDENTQAGLYKETTNFPHVELYGKLEGRYILFSSFSISERNVLFLLAPFERKPSAEEIASVVSKINFFHSPTETRAELARYARRSYPDYLLCDEDIWLEIERESGTNWALSAEEEQILSNCAPPLFINGRAGSGKTTMLFYLFAAYCDRFQKNIAPGQDLSDLPHPLFLTYNKKLLEEAKKGVLKILDCHHKFLLTKVDKTNGVSTEDMAHFFQPFQDLLLSLLPAEESDRFDPDQHISFHQFKQFYNQRFQRSHSAEVCWHVIRSFIKGYRHSYLTPDNYQEVPRKERTISLNTFQNIYNTIWPWYEQLTTSEGYWDDQDLIKKVLDLKCYRPQYTAILCDEAQDFTKLELKLIMQLSVLCQYDLEYQFVQTLPFAFAGDPLQTLNPTGFRWESVKAAFYDQAIALLDPARQLNIKMKFQELESNYRSSPSIVKVTNLIHLWRHILFDIPDLKPQKAWQQIEAPEPQKFIFGRNLSFEELKPHIEKDPIFIVPCEAGGEIDYIRQDDILSQLFPQLSETTPPKNVLSAIEAKGLEFPLVILYKFGDRFAKEHGKEHWKISTKEDYPLPLEYFFNKLYVAASRAKEELLVFDTIEGEQQFWQYGNQLERFLIKARDRNIWEPHIGAIASGDNLAVLNRDNREAQAKEFEQNGLSQEDPDLLRRAKQFYTSLGRGEKAEICEAFALKFEKRFRDAGQIFLRRSKNNEAWECFWQGTCWSELKQWYEKHSARKIEQAIVDFMTQNHKNLETLKKFTLFLEENGEKLPKNYLSKPWKTAIQEYVRQIAKLQKYPKIEQKDWQKFGDILEALDSAKYNGCAELAGDCFYRAENFKRAVTCWNACKATQKREYNLAYAEVQGFPEGLEYLEKAEAYRRIVGEWEKAGKPRNTQWVKNFEYVERALIKLNRHKELVEYLIQTKRWVEAIAAVEKCSEAEATSLRYDLLREIARSNLTPEEARVGRSRYKLLIERIQASPDWRQHVTIKQLGIALERIGEFVPTLEFYEKFFHRSDNQIKQFAKERWLATKKKQLAYEESTTNTSRYNEIRQEIAAKVKEWNINLNSITLEPPSPDSQTTQPIVSNPTSIPEQNLQTTPSEQPKSWIEGLPNGTELKTLGLGTASFQIAQLEIKIAKTPTAMQILIADIFTSKVLRINLERSRCKIAGDAVVETADPNQLSFKTSAEDYSGLIFYNSENPRIELNIPGCPSTISLKL